MGELRNSILEMGKQVATAAKTGDKLGEDLDSIAQRVSAHYDRLYAGHDMLYLYLEAQFEKKNQKYKDNVNDKLSVHADSEVLTYLKGIDQAADDCLKAIDEFAKLKAKMPGEYDRIDALAMSIRRNIAKKRGKLLQSKKYKTKIQTYENAVIELENAIRERRKIFNKINTRSPKQVNDLRLKATSKVSDVRNVSVKSTLDTMKKAVEEDKWVARKFRENGDLKNAFTQMKQWADEADSMDQEVANLDPDLAKPLKDVKLVFNKKVVATAPKATFAGKRGMEVTVTWQKGVNFLDLLQKKITVQAEFAAGGGNFVHDMKVTGVKDKIVKLL